MDELVRFIARSLVDDPDAVQVETKQDGDCTVIELHVAPGDMGKVIGRQGRIAKAIRTVVKAASAREHGKYAVEIV
ncbi:MAG TPA: KH domain-containing protein [Candidatus Aphodomorpha intestinavium]|uniref:RNA-binding protein KhpA n=1 Tax=Candidatus Aphodomorpha intestinavium TaxID=2840672 RepID=A0A9D1N3L8_9FIRM|nr:KH domain-containing protein [Candidatus Aphodomorpha intestinavium]